jgi:hypothetical protein
MNVLPRFCERRMYQGVPTDLCDQACVIRDKDREIC